MLVQPGEPEHVVNQQSHSPSLNDNAAHRLIHLRTAGKGTLPVELGVGAQRGQGSAQLVTGIREESPGRFFAGRPLADGRLDAGEHPVEGGPEAAHFGRRIVRSDPAGEVAGGDLVRRGGHYLDRPEPSAHHETDPGDDDHGDG